MALTDEQQQAIDSYLNLRIYKWEESRAEERERIIRIEETVKSGFEAMEKRFEQMDRRFEEMQHSIDKRFEQMQHSMDKRFEQMQRSMDKRFEELLHYTDKRFEDVNRRFSSLQWTMGIGFSLILITTTLSKFIA